MVNADYELTPAQVKAILHAKTVGVIFQAAYGAPVFFGFYDMPTEGGAEKITGFLNSCHR
jgi:hypothetical protein